MSLSISLSNDDGSPFLPGSMVLGVVKLVTFDDQPIGDLTIAFTGRANVLLIHSYGDMTTSRRDYKSVGYLFSQHLNLYQGKYTHRRGNYMWPFAFQIPLSATPRVLPFGSKDYFRPEHPWKNDYSVDCHPLPPSMAYSGPYICSIEYTLHAKLSQPGRASITLNRGLNAVNKVRVQNLSMPQDLLDPSLAPEWQQPYANYRHKVQCTLDDGMSHTIRERICSIFPCQKGPRQGKPTGTPAPPKLELHISVRMPKRIVLKDPATMALSVIVAATSHSVVESTETSTGQNPSVRDTHFPRHTNHLVASFKLSLVQHTHVRAGCHRSSSEKRIFVRKGSCMLPVVSRRTASSSTSSASCLLEPTSAESSAADEADQGNSSSSNTSPPPPPPPSPGEVSIDLANVTDLTVPTTAALVPDFSTYNIARSHSLDVQFKMEYEKKRFKFRLRNIPLQILSPNCYGEGQVDLRPGGGLSQLSTLGDDAWIVPPPSECDDLNDESAVNALNAEPPPQYA